MWVGLCCRLHAGQNNHYNAGNLKYNLKYNLQKRFTRLRVLNINVQEETMINRDQLSFKGGHRLECTNIRVKNSSMQHID